jgi:hypothetical protein
MESKTHTLDIITEVLVSCDELEDLGLLAADHSKKEIFERAAKNINCLVTEIMNSEGLTDQDLCDNLSRLMKNVLKQRKTDNSKTRLSKPRTVAGMFNKRVLIQIEARNREMGVNTV